ncbi:hypothetical protein Vi05172_g9843 [Venturia inaequalis]|nr:hypothetical protein Vi05172_g9843 [Venturia inaequalis]
MKLILLLSLAAAISALPIAEPMAKPIPQKSGGLSGPGAKTGGVSHDKGANNSGGGANRATGNSKSRPGGK